MEPGKNTHGGAGNNSDHRFRPTVVMSFLSRTAQALISLEVDIDGSMPGK